MMKARVLSVLLSLVTTAAFAQDAPVRTLFTHVNVFNGVHEKRIENANVLIEDNLISSVSSGAIEANGATVIDGGGRTLMPGLTDAHWHVMHAHISSREIMGWTKVADGVPQVMRRVRENLMSGATQIKVMAGGGVASFSDPLDVRQYTLEEMKAAVDTAATWNTYVLVHAYSDVAVRGALEAGVQSIDHGQMITEDTAKLIKKKDAWLSLQPLLNDEDAPPFPDGSFEQQKFLEMTRGTENAYALAKKYDLKVAFGSDLQNGAEIAAKQGKALAKQAYTGHIHSPPAVAL